MDTQDTQTADDTWAALNAQAVALDNELAPPVSDHKTANEVVEPETAELLAPVIKITADLVAPNWALTEVECEQLANSYAALLDKYLPENGLNNYGVEITALLTTGIVFSSRKGIPMRKKEDKKQQVEQKKKNNENAALIPKAVIDD
jgi:hypothetical protein